MVHGTKYDWSWGKRWTVPPERQPRASKHLGSVQEHPEGIKPIYTWNLLSSLVSKLRSAWNQTWLIMRKAYRVVQPKTGIINIEN